MNCKFAKINGSKCLVNFKTDGDRFAGVIQKMCKDVEVIEVKRIEVSDLDSGTLIINEDTCLQMSPEDAAYVYTRFNIIRR